MDSAPWSARVHAGVPATNMTLFRVVRLALHDPAAVVIFDNGERVAILRDVEIERARTAARVDAVYPYEQFTPEGGLSGDREIRAAQSLAAFLKDKAITEAVADRTLPLLFAEELRAAGIQVRLDKALGVQDRRRKTPEEIEALREAQEITESAVRMACELIASSDVADDGVLIDPRPGHAGRPLTSEVVKAAIIGRLAEQGAVTDEPIVAGGPGGSDCHWTGGGPLRTGEPVIVDVFPRHVATGFHGDCTRTVVHGEAGDIVRAMHAAVVEAKAAAIKVLAAAQSAEHVHRAAIEVIERHGFHSGWAPDHAPASYTSMPHGTGHGIGLDLKELPLLDDKGPELVAGDCVTVEPGLYRPDTGGVRVEDMLVVTEQGSENLNRLPEGLDWKP